ncbi:Asp-tRNA(Asn)/Glu-tRNA(Gln) amidotransferase subunit GatC [Helicobacter sp. 11S03491-1]|uniref:Asp-tRNA(Asn)/Glu-tRNA(Gln) amidotransferase subunit GatC n=1 Tax=Helicobacter sp. 11S03491-1 TaxID=1476196 RepID=UPI000BA7E2E2|nr:Asp-tRNA(Asn)/Glu-tRNA(Gln) amidotransferase subunit GatC [Helicobacter sp. 11S03491-1]PAF43916.1 asparaginyl/glutamyl-tRNA amidotransferase subunit C [Helicobacter sp. 11S03491-1]
MMIDDKLLQKLEKLGMIALDEDKKEAIKKDLNDILGFVDNISQLEIEDTPNSSQTQAKTPLRQDCKNNDPLIAQIVLKNAPGSQDGYFIVPKIIE